MLLQLFPSDRHGGANVGETGFAGKEDLEDPPAYRLASASRISSRLLAFGIVSILLDGQ